MSQLKAKYLSALDLNELTALMKELNVPAFRAKQIFQEITGKFNSDVLAMKSLPGDLRQTLAEQLWQSPVVLKETVECGQNVKKLLLALEDEEVIEVAVIPDEERVTLCLSTQVGCPVQCRFCASGRGGLVRNLLAGEIMESFLCGCRIAGKKVDNIVFMGIGEGLLNCRELFKALELLTGNFEMSPRRITVSTSGYVPGILKFAQLQREFNLAISLHAPDDETRAKLIPEALRYPVKDILDAADIWSKKCNRQYTLEYTLIAEINDSNLHAEALGRLAYRHHAKVNLIPYNDTKSSTFKRPGRERIEEFMAIVKAAGARCTRRVERGSGGKAACGQLRVNALKNTLLWFFILALLFLAPGCQAFRRMFAPYQPKNTAQSTGTAEKRSSRDPVRDMFGMPERAEDAPQILSSSDLSAREQEILRAHYQSGRRDPDILRLHENMKRKQKANDERVFGKNPFGER